MHGKGASPCVIYIYHLHFTIYLPTIVRWAQTNFKLIPSPRTINHIQAIVSNKRYGVTRQSKSIAKVTRENQLSPVSPTTFHVRQRVYLSTTGAVEQKYKQRKLKKKHTEKNYTHRGGERANPLYFVYDSTG